MPPTISCRALAPFFLATTLLAPAAYCEPASTPPVQTTAKLSFIGLESQVPTAWTIVAPETSKRLAQFRIETPGEGRTAEVIVYYFGKGEGGSAEANIERWQGQFVAGNHPVTPIVNRFQSNGMNVTTAEFQGSYARGIGVGPVGTPKPNQILLAAVVESPQGNIIIQLHGAAATVNAQREGFLAFIRSIRGEAI